MKNNCDVFINALKILDYDIYEVTFKKIKTHYFYVKNEKYIVIKEKSITSEQYLELYKRAAGMKKMARNTMKIKQQEKSIPEKKK